jgi:hypothetical protein
MTDDGRPPLHLAPPPSAERPDTRVSVALALLRPIMPLLDLTMTDALCPDGYDTARADELESDPRYVIGRLHQALTALLAGDIPAPDATAVLLAEALGDAIEYRERDCPRCGPQGSCAECWQHWRKASEYRALAVDLGVIEAMPGAPGPLTVLPGGER